MLSALALLAAGCSNHSGHTHGPSKAGALPIGNTHPGYCQVAGDKIDDVAKAEAEGALHADYQGKRYLFCCEDCKPAFEKDPAKYVKSPPPPKKEGGGEHK
ncbi:MAG: YHS domain-containing protein [Planctomycetes bacterium]|nr:YHS domain-containing protein [Planctomycetota bacterium]